jgi:hypothetical protein
MNNPFLQQRSLFIFDGAFDQIEKCCFFALCGKTQNDAAIKIEFSINLFDDPKKT